MVLCRRGLIRWRLGIRALLFWVARKYSFSRVCPGVSSFFVILSLVRIGLTIVAFSLGCFIVLTLGVGVVFATLGVGVALATLGVGVSLAALGATGCCFCGGFAVSSNVTRLLSGGVGVVSAGILFRISSSLCSASISLMPFLFRRAFRACVRSFNAFTIVSSGVKVGSVMCLCLKCTVSDILLLLVLLE